MFSQAFPEVRLDRFAGAFWVGVAGAVWAYLAASITTGLSAQSLSTLLAVFLVTGALSSALSSSDPRWWEQNFSTLGAAADASGITFDVTLLVGGFVLIAVGDFVAHELWVWLTWRRTSSDPADVDPFDDPAAPSEDRATPERRRDVHTVIYVRTVLLVFGGLTAAVALIPVSAHKMLHDVAAQSLVVVFALALLTLPVVLRRLPGSLNVITAIALGLLAFELVLYKGVDYLNTTAFEMGATATVLIWLMLLIRTVAAAADDVRAEQGHAGKGGGVVMEFAPTGRGATDRRGAGDLPAAPIPPGGSEQRPYVDARRADAPPTRVRREVPAGEIDVPGRQRLRPADATTPVVPDDHASDSGVHVGDRE